MSRRSGDSSTSHVDRTSSRRQLVVILHRTRLLLCLGWALAVLCSIPQSIVFSLETHPVISSYRQCINTVALTDPDRELLYFLYFFILSWVLPIMVMMICYVSIIITICRRTKKNILGRLRCQSLGGNMKYGLCPNWF